MGVDKSGCKLRTASVFLYELKVVGSVLALLVNISHAAQKWVADDLGVIFEEVDLKKKLSYLDP